MDKLKNFNFHLGIPQLLTEWKKLFSPRYLGADLAAGVSVAFVAIPLSLAIALASGVPPATGLVTAIIAGIVCALFGGAPLSVSGPAAAMSVLIADTVENYGLKALVVMCLMSGIMQLLSGMFGLGKLGRYVPLPVIAGFTAGIGVIIIIGQLPRALGMLPPPESHISDVLLHIQQYQNINFSCLVITIATVLIIRLLPKINTKLPAILIAIIATTAVVYFLQLKDIPLIGAIPNSLPAPSIPLVSGITLDQLFLNAFAIYLLASLETLLSASSIDKLTTGKKHDADQELIGQGLGNIAVSLFGGIPVTGVIARSITNIRAGAKTRRASIIHSFIILLAVYVISPWISNIPIAALAGVLFSVAFSMINYREFHGLLKISHAEALIYAITFFTLVFVDLIAGVQAGIVAAGIIVLFKAAKTNLYISTTAQDETIRLSLTGSLTFLSTKEITDLEKKLQSITPGKTVIVDLSDLTNIDSSGTTAIIDLFNLCHSQKVNFYIKGLPRRFESLFKMWGGEKIIEEYHLVSENELKEKEADLAPKSARGRLIHGVKQFYAERKLKDRRLFDYIATKQDPHTLFITCSDSRLNPALITSTDPGELFIIRNVGNCIPPYEFNSQHSETAALEFTLGMLDITDIIICGHASCGAIKACCGQDKLPDGLQNWINILKEPLEFNADMTVNEVAKINVLNQIENLKTYPMVQEKIHSGKVKIHAWFYDFSESTVYEWDSEKEQFEPVGIGQEQSEVPEKE